MVLVCNESARRDRSDFSDRIIKHGFHHNTTLRNDEPAARLAVDRTNLPWPPICALILLHLHRISLGALHSCQTVAIVGR